MIWLSCQFFLTLSRRIIAGFLTSISNQHFWRQNTCFSRFHPTPFMSDMNIFWSQRKAYSSLDQISVSGTSIRCQVPTADKRPRVSSSGDILIISTHPYVQMYSWTVHKKNLRSFCLVSQLLPACTYQYKYIVEIPQIPNRNAGTINEKYKNTSLLDIHRNDQKIHLINHCNE